MRDEGADAHHVQLELGAQQGVRDPRLLGLAGQADHEARADLIAFGAKVPERPQPALQS